MRIFINLKTQDEYDAVIGYSLLNDYKWIEKEDFLEILSEQWDFYKDKTFFVAYPKQKKMTLFNCSWDERSAYTAINDHIRTSEEWTHEPIITKFFVRLLITQLKIKFKSYALL